MYLQKNNLAINKHRSAKVRKNQWKDEEKSMEGQKESAKKWRKYGIGLEGESFFPLARAEFNRTCASKAQPRSLS